MKVQRSFIISLVFVCLAAGVAWGAEDKREVEGRELFAKGEYVKALDVYAKLFAEKGDPLYLRNVGRCYQKLKQPEKAVDAFREYLRRAKVKPKERQEVEGFIHEMEELQAKQPPPPPTEPPPPQPAAVTATPAPAAPPPHPTPLPAAVDPGPAKQTPATTLTTTPAENADDTPITHRWWFWAGIAGVVAAGVVTAIIVTRGPDRLECPPNVSCPQ